MAEKETIVQRRLLLLLSMMLLVAMGFVCGLYCQNAGNNLWDEIGRSYVLAGDSGKYGKIQLPQDSRAYDLAEDGLPDLDKLYRNGHQEGWYAAFHEFKMKGALYV